VYVTLGMGWPLKMEVTKKIIILARAFNNNKLVLDLSEDSFTVK
jgi:hypothetical protein